MDVVVMPWSDHVTFVHEATEGTLYAWDVTAAERIVADGRPAMLFNLEEQGVTTAIIERIYSGLNRAHALSADLTRPLIAIPYRGEILLIDGWHRLWRAAHEGVPELQMHLLSSEEASSIKCLELPPGHGVNWREC
jgi:hypothetical protein